MKVQKGMKKSAVSAEKAAWKTIKKRRARARTRRMMKEAAPAEEAPKKAMQKGMEKAAAPAEEAHKNAMQKGMKKKAVSTEKAHWKGLKKRMKKLKKQWLAAPTNADAKEQYRTAQKAVFEFTKKLGTGDAADGSSPAGNGAAPHGGESAQAAAFREARRLWKKDRKSDALFQAMQVAKAVMDAAAGASGEGEGPASTVAVDTTAAVKAAAAERPVACPRPEQGMLAWVATTFAGLFALGAVARPSQQPIGNHVNIVDTMTRL